MSVSQMRTLLRVGVAHDHFVVLGGLLVLAGCPFAGDSRGLLRTSSRLDDSGGVCGLGATTDVSIGESPSPFFFLPLFFFSGVFSRCGCDVRPRVLLLPRGSVAAVWTPGVGVAEADDVLDAIGISSSAPCDISVGCITTSFGSSMSSGSKSWSAKAISFPMPM